MWGVRGRALSHHRPLFRPGVRPGPTTHWLWVRGLRAWGPVDNPTARALASWLCPLWGRHEGARGGAPLAWVWGVRGRALSQPRPLVRSGVRPGPTTHWLWVRGMPAWGPVTNLTARALASWLCALWGQHDGTWDGAPLAWVWGVRGRALLRPRPLVRSGVRPGPTTHWLWVRGVRAWGPVTNPTARALASWLCALWERHEGARGGRLLPGCGASWVGRSPPPTPLVHSGVRPGPTTHWLWVRGVRIRGPVTNPTARALASLLCALWGRHGVPGGGAFCLGVGRPGTGALPPLTSRPFARPAGDDYPLAVVAGGAGVRTRHQPHSARSCVLWGRHEGARGGRLLPGCGASGVGRSPTPDPSFFQACGWGPVPTGCRCWGCGRGDPSPTPERALLRAGFAPSLLGPTLSPGVPYQVRLGAGWGPTARRGSPPE